MLGYVPCFRDFDVCSICMGDGCDGVGAASGMSVVGSCWRRWVFVVWCVCVCVKMEVSRDSLLL